MRPHHTADCDLLLLPCRCLPPAPLPPSSGPSCCCPDAAAAAAASSTRSCPSCRGTMGSSSMEHSQPRHCTGGDEGMGMGRMRIVRATEEVIPAQGEHRYVTVLPS